MKKNVLLVFLIQVSLYIESVNILYGNTLGTLVPVPFYNKTVNCTFYQFSKRSTILRPQITIS
jgi:hypothetical protein